MLRHCAPPWNVRRHARRSTSSGPRRRRWRRSCQACRHSAEWSISSTSTPRSGASSRATLPPLAWWYGLEAARLHRLEAQIAATADSVLVVSESEAALLRGALPTAALHVVQNGVDTRYFHPVARADGARPPQLVFCGS